jgi:hypothetical protein
MARSSVMLVAFDLAHIVGKECPRSLPFSVDVHQQLPGLTSKVLAEFVDDFGSDVRTGLICHFRQSRPMDAGRLCNFCERNDAALLECLVCD